MKKDFVENLNEPEYTIDDFVSGFERAIEVLKKDCDRDRHAEAIVLLEAELEHMLKNG